MDDIHVIMTGGTIDSVWSGAHDTVIVSEHSTLPEYFSELGKNLKFPFEFTFTEVCMKDSRQITDADRKDMLKAIEQSKSKHILVTHGTYTMPETARYLKKTLNAKTKYSSTPAQWCQLKASTFPMAHLILALRFPCWKN